MFSNSISLLIRNKIDYLFELSDFADDIFVFLFWVDLLHENVNNNDRKVILEVIFLWIFSNSNKLFNNIALMFICIIEFLEALNDFGVFWFKSFNKVIKSCHRVMSKYLIFTVINESLNTFLLLFFFANLSEPLIKERVCFKLSDQFLLLLVCINIQNIKVIKGILIMWEVFIFWNLFDKTFDSIWFVGGIKYLQKY